jgi:hypothetical protein
LLAAQVAVKFAMKSVVDGMVSKDALDTLVQVSSGLHVL